MRAFARARLSPGYLERATSEEFPAAVYQQLADQGLLSLAVPAADGGQGADLVSIGIACEEIARADVNVAYFVFASVLAAYCLAQGEQGRRLLPSLANGEVRVALALTEPASGSDAGALQARAEPVEGGWRLHGEKTSVTMGPIASHAIVFARTDAQSSGPRGVSALLVSLDDPTVVRQRFRDPGFRPIGRGSLNFDGTFVPACNLLGDEGRGFNLVMREFDLTRVLLALMCIGCAERALEITGDYVRERKTFGLPLARNQGVAFPIAEHATHLAACKALAYQTLQLREAGRPHTKEAAMLKWWGPQIAYAAIHECIVLHGHVGWSEEMPLQQMLRDVSGFEIGDGTPQIQKAIIAREILGREYLSYGFADQFAR